MKPKFKVIFEGKEYQVRRLTFDKNDNVRGVQFRDGNDTRYLRLDSGRIILFMIESSSGRWDAVI